MRVTVSLVFAVVICIVYVTEACEPAETHIGCKIDGDTCICGHGCKSEFVHRNRRVCLNALRGKFTEKDTNMCYGLPCARGICLQTLQDPGFICKCEGTGFYGDRCEQAYSENQSFPDKGILH